MRKFIILAAALVALVVPTAAMAVVAVDATTGYGVVGKGDVQDALGLANDEAMQKLFNRSPMAKRSSSRPATTWCSTTRSTA